MLQKIGRLILKILGVVLLLLIVMLLVFDRLVQFRLDDRDLQAHFDSLHIPARIAYYQAGGRKVRYVRVGEQDRAKATILFIHGAPGSCSYWKAYLSDTTLLRKFTMYAVDRPGYGYSGYGDPLADVAAQAAIIRPILDSLQKTNHPIILVGASYGSTIVSRLAMDYPSLVDGLVLIAPPLGPGRERIFWFTYMVESPVIHWVVPRMLVSANREKIHHRADLEAMLPHWSSIHVPIDYLQGTEDGLVDTSNAGFARSHLVNAVSLDIQMIPGRGHLITFNEKDRIEAAILDVLAKTGKAVPL